MTITIQQIVFYFFSTLAILSAIMVIASKNPVRAVLFLVFSIFCMAGIWMLLESEFLSIVLVLVYVGAVMVLFLFVVMMLDIEAPTLHEPFVKHWPLGILIACVMIGLMAMIVGTSHFGLDIYSAPAPLPKDYSHVKVLATLLYSDYLLPFEVAGIILLVAMIAAIGLTFRGKRNARSQKVYLQTRVTKQERLTIVKMPAQKRD